MHTTSRQAVHEHRHVSNRRRSNKQHPTQGSKPQVCYSDNSMLTRLSVPVAGLTWGGASRFIFFIQINLALREYFARLGREFGPDSMIEVRAATQFYP